MSDFKNFPIDDRIGLDRREFPIPSLTYTCSACDRRIAVEHEDRHNEIFHAAPVSAVPATDDTGHVTAS